jgi:hypothetical protein
MKKRRNILSLILKLNKKLEGASLAYDEEVIGYEAFPSRYLDKIIKNYRYSVRFFEKAEKISSTDI